MHGDSGKRASFPRPPMPRNVDIEGTWPPLPADASALPSSIIAAARHDVAEGHRILLSMFGGEVRGAHSLHTAWPYHSTVARG